MKTLQWAKVRDDYLDAISKAEKQKIEDCNKEHGDGSLLAQGCILMAMIGADMHEAAVKGSWHARW